MRIRILIFLRSFIMMLVLSSRRNSRLSLWFNSLIWGVFSNNKKIITSSNYNSNSNYSNSSISRTRNF